MSLNTSELVSLVQNPALGAYCIWKFSIAFCTKGQQASIPLDYLYYVLPFVSNGRFRYLACKTNKSLWKFREKLRKERCASSLLEMPRLVSQFRSLSSDSIEVAFACGLLTFDWGLGGIVLLKKTTPDKLLDLSTIEKDYGKAASRLAVWASKMSRNEFLFALGIK